MVFNLHNSLSKLESKKNRRYSFAEIAEISGLTRQGVRRMLKEPTKQVDVQTLTRLVAFFEHEGMSITVADLFIDSPDTLIVSDDTFVDDLGITAQGNPDETKNSL